jgi:hypothetical protein
MLTLLESCRATSRHRAPLLRNPAALPGEAWLPQRGLGFLALRRLRGGAQEAAHITAAAAKAARDLSAMAAQGFFLPFCLTMIAVLARIHVCVSAGCSSTCSLTMIAVLAHIHVCVSTGYSSFCSLKIRAFSSSILVPGWLCLGLRFHHAIVGLANAHAKICCADLHGADGAGLRAGVQRDGGAAAAASRCRRSGS